jgi:dipeptidyl aminopeptidase/acylaminoacyl peptidase
MLRSLFAALAATLALALPAVAGTPVAAPTAFLSQADCLEATPDYASWLDSTSRSIDGKPVSKALLQSLVPATVFSFARAAFDCRIVSYASDGHIVSGYVIRPRLTEAVGKLPLLVYNRGGNGDYGKLDSLQVFLKLLPLAKAGFTVVASQYRDADEFGGKDVDDVMHLIDLSLALPEVDGDRIFLLGQSRGAMMSYLVARRRGDITAIATIGGVSDLRAGLAWRPEMERIYRARIPDYDSNKQAALDARSARYWAEHLPTDMPVLLLHGELDDRVNVEDARAMAARLQQLGRPHKLLVYPGDDHGLHTNWRSARAEILDWFKSTGGLKVDGN